MSLHMGSTENALKELERQRSREMWKAALGAFDHLIRSAVPA